MTFQEFNQWVKENGLELQLSGWGCCFPDLIKIYKDKKLIIREDYNTETDYQKIKENIEEMMKLPELPYIEDV